jgi:hypothetical protein
VKPKPKAVNKPSPHSIVHGLDKPGVFTTVSCFLSFLLNLHMGVINAPLCNYLERKIPVSVISRLLGVNRLTVRHYIHTRKLQKPAS